MSDYTPLPEIPNPLTNGKVIKTDCTIKEYLASKGGENGGPRILSRGDLCEIATCPSRWHKGYVEEERRLPNVEFGSLFDCLLLQPARFKEYCTIAPAEYTNSKKQVVPWTWKSSTCRDWREKQESAGHLVCDQEHLSEAESAVDALCANPFMGEQTRRLIANSTHQVFVIAEYHDKETGIVVPVKCLTDIVPNPDDEEFGKSLFDLKTAMSAEPRQWKRAVIKSDYHVQGAINLDCHQACGSERWDFRHLIVENFAPFEPARRFLGSDMMTLGRMKYLAALKTLCRCIKTNEWPSYSDPSAKLVLNGYESVDLEAWMLP